MPLSVAWYSFGGESSDPCFLCFSKCFGLFCTPGIAEQSEHEYTTAIERICCRLHFFSHRFHLHLSNILGSSKTALRLRNYLLLTPLSRQFLPVSEVQVLEKAFSKEETPTSGNIRAASQVYRVRYGAFERTVKDKVLGNVRIFVVTSWQRSSDPVTRLYHWFTSAREDAGSYYDFDFHNAPGSTFPLGRRSTNLVDYCTNNLSYWRKTSVFQIQILSGGSLLIRSPNWAPNTHFRGHGIGWFIYT